MDTSSLEAVVRQTVAETLSQLEAEKTTYRIGGREPKKEEESLLLTSREAAKMLAISKRTLWDLTDRGEIPRVKIGWAVRYSRGDLEEFVRKMKQTGTKEEGNQDGQHQS